MLVSGQTEPSPVAPGQSLGEALTRGSTRRYHARFQLGQTEVFQNSQIIGTEVLDER